MENRLEDTKFIKNIVRDLNERKHGRFMVVTGAPGDGKSYMALHMAEVIDPSFTLDNVAVAKSEEFLDLLDKSMDGSLKSGSVIVLDEAGAGMGAREWQTAQNKVLAVIFQVIRKLGLFVIMTLPTWAMLDINARRVTSIYAHAVGIDYKKELSSFKIYNVTYNDMFNELGYRKIEDNSGTKIDTWHFRLPEIDLVAYETHKDESIKWLFDTARDTFEKIDNKNNGGNNDSLDMRIEIDLRSGMSVKDVADKNKTTIAKVDRANGQLKKHDALECVCVS